MELITMSAKEIDRFTVISNLIAGSINGSAAAEQLHLTQRQVRRIKKRFKKDDPKSVIHQGRGRESNRKLKQTLIDKIIGLYNIVSNYTSSSILHNYASWLFYFARLSRRNNHFGCFFAKIIG